MKKSYSLLMVLTTVILILVPVASAVKISQAADILLGTAIHQEEVEGDLEAAIETYKKLLAEYPDNHPLAAQAQFRIGICYEKLGLNEAEKAFQKVIENYPDQAAMVEMAREKLAVLARAHSVAKKGEQDLIIQKIWSGPEVDLLGDISPDGKYFCFTDWETGDLAVRELVTGKNRHISNKGPWKKSYEFAMFPKWSPDGRFLAYGWYDYNSENDHFELRLIELGETQPRILFEHKVKPVADIFPVDWHPNGTQILTYIGKKPGTFELGFISVTDKTVQIVKTFKESSGGSGIPWNFFVSPDGCGIAYDKVSPQNPKNRDIFLLSKDGSQEKCLIEHPAADSVCGWTADGRFLLFKSDRSGVVDLWIVEVEDGKALGTPSLLKADMGGFIPLGCTRQNQFCYGYQNSGNDVYLGEIDPASGQFLAPPDKKVRLYEGRNAIPECSPDGKYFLYISRRGFSPRDKYVLCLYSLETDEIRELNVELEINRFSFPQWRPDGKAISLTGIDNEGRYGIYLFELGSENLSPLVLFTKEKPVYHHRWAKDGQTLFYTGGKSRESLMVYARELNTGVEKALTSPLDNIKSIGISPDGQWLAFVDGGALKINLKIIPTSGGESQKLYSFEGMGLYDITPSWSADGKYIFFCNMTALGTWGMWRFSMEERQAKKIGPQGLNFRYPSLLPDGRHIIFSTESEAPPEVWLMENFLPRTKKQK